jgi:hypothetical protein
MYDNTRGLGTNLLFDTYHRWCQLRWAFSRRRRHLPPETPLVQRAVSDLREQGFCILEDVLDPELVSTLARKVGELAERHYRPEDTKAGSTGIPDCRRAVPEVLGCLAPPVTETLERFYRSHFKIYFIDVHRLIPMDGPPVSSWLWHSDNNPAPVLKVMVYLTDTTEQTGAFRAVPWPLSRSILRRGFRDRNHAEPFLAELNDRANQVIMEGKPGTVMIFTNNLLHKATPPRERFRDTVVFEVCPSPIPWADHLPRVIDRVDQNADISANPRTPFF